MASLSLLLQFLDFVESRVQTSSLSLFRRILRDFYAGNEHTLVEFMRLGATVVSIFPIEIKSQRRLLEAERLLTRQNAVANQKQPLNIESQSGREEQKQPCVFRYLLARVATKNILWLRDFFQDFCNGEDALLKEFLRRGDESINVIPVDIQALCMAPLPPPPLMINSPSYVIASVGALEGTAAAPRSDGGYNGNDSSNKRFGKKIRRTAVTTQGKAKIGGQRTTTVEPVSRVKMAGSVDELRRRILEVMQCVEAQEPWVAVFKVAELPCPFSRVKHPQLASALDDFWVSHARAVWERQFWAPLARKRCPEAHYQRRFRQAKAQQVFESTVMVPAYEELGAAFFVGLDQLARPHEGWWYLGQVEDLFTMAQHIGLSACVRYMESQAFKRTPDSPGGGRRFFTTRNEESISMWSSSSTLQRALREIRDLKTSIKAAVE